MKETSLGKTLLALGGESLAIGCLAPLFALLLVAGTIAISGTLPVWALATAIILLLAAIPIVVLLAVRATRRNRAP